MANKRPLQKEIILFCLNMCRLSIKTYSFFRKKTKCKLPVDEFQTKVG